MVAFSNQLLHSSSLPPSSSDLQNCLINIRPVLMEKGFLCITKVGSLGLTGKFGLGIQNEAGQRLIEFCQENALVIANTLFQHTREGSTYGYHQMVNTEIRLIIFFAAKDGEALYSQQKQDQELTVAQIMNSLLPNSD